MTMHAVSYLDAVERLAIGETLVLPGVTWDEYEQLLDELGDSYPVRVTFDRGRLEIMSPTLKHEYYKESISHVARAIADEMNCEIECLGSTTYRQQWLGRGVEPDACFYVQNAAAIIGKDQIDLATDPPPDIVVEIDIARSSESKFSIYAGMNAMELWVCSERGAIFYHLGKSGYEKNLASRAFPLVSSGLFFQFLKQCTKLGQSAALRSFRDSIRAQRDHKE
jgi:Uma2 family endonuclease